MTDNTQESRDLIQICTDIYYECETIKRLDELTDEALDWHNKQIEEVIRKPHILPKNAQHQESVKQGINFYHRQMRKRVDKLKELLK